MAFDEAFKESGVGSVEGGAEEVVMDAWWIWWGVRASWGRRNSEIGRCDRKAGL